MNTMTKLYGKKLAAWEKTRDLNAELRPALRGMKRAGRSKTGIAATTMRLKKRGKGVVAVPDTEPPQLTAQQVRSALERVRR
ncbi:MAG: hypothetical protein HYU76_01875 [Betaproteobacteria bacterium]|nr:hypothetical protein [Betaproteobacteria bacterium]